MTTPNLGKSTSEHNGLTKPVPVVAELTILHTDNFFLKNVVKITNMVIPQVYVHNMDINKVKDSEPILVKASEKRRIFIFR